MIPTLMNVTSQSSIVSSGAEEDDLKNIMAVHALDSIITFSKWIRLLLHQSRDYNTISENHSFITFINIYPSLACKATNNLVVENEEEWHSDNDDFLYQPMRGTSLYTVTQTLIEARTSEAAQWWHIHFNKQIKLILLSLTLLNECWRDLGMQIDS